MHQQLNLGNYSKYLQYVQKNACVSHNEKNIAENSNIGQVFVAVNNAFTGLAFGGKFLE